MKKRLRKRLEKRLKKRMKKILIFFSIFFSIFLSIVPYDHGKDSTEIRIRADFHSFPVVKKRLEKILEKNWKKGWKKIEFFFNLFFQSFFFQSLYMDVAILDFCLGSNLGENHHCFSYPSKNSIQGNNSIFALLSVVTK